MRDLSKLFSINLIGKIITLVLFSLLAHSLNTIHLAYIALIPALSPTFLSLLGCGVNTLLERDVPRVLSQNQNDGHKMMRAGYLLNLLSISLAFIFGISLINYWVPAILNGYSYEKTTISWICLPIGTYMLLQTTGLFLLLEGKAPMFGFIRITGDISAKALTLILYMVEPSEMAVFIGLSVGQLPLIAYGIWQQRKWLFSTKLSPIIQLLRNSWPFYLEANFNVLRNQGDNLLVSSLLGPISMAGYYVAKTVANQLSVFFNPVSSLMVHRFSYQQGHGMDSLEQIFKQAWCLSVPLFVWLSCALGALSPLLIEFIAGSDYMEIWPTALLLCLVSCCLALYSLSSRILLLIGSSFERFKVTAIQTMLILLFSLLLVPLLDTAGIALAWLIASFVTLYIIRHRSLRLGFSWPKSNSIIKPLLSTLSMPAISLYLYYQGTNNAVVLFVFLLTATASFAIILFSQNEYEEAQMLHILPEQLTPFYRQFRNLKTKIYFK